MQLWSLLFRIFMSLFRHSACRSGCQVGTPAEATHVLPGATMARDHVRQAPQGNTHTLCPSRRERRAVGSSRDTMMHFARKAGQESSNCWLRGDVLINPRLQPPAVCASVLGPQQVRPEPSTSM